MKILLVVFGGGIRTINRKHLPKRHNGYVVVCTHKTWIDVVALGIAMKPTPLYYMAKKELFKSTFMNWFFTSLHAFPVDRENPGPSTLKIPQKLIKNGKVVGIFPSGTRSVENAGLKRGAFVIAKRAGVPIVPAVYNGPISLKGLFKREKITVVFGEPIDLNDYHSKEDAEIVLKHIEDTFLQLEKIEEK
ncbi:1-acyl-sn-glycerol-3-phosphate acyltransferase [Halalkalibacter sp. APA_J-10(15)]|uniref:lysophospholipid acyltransferase family protein n=1 Tax=unclassified Halalkalibacter TaxID=2893063 RepID=UPI001FF4102F|nr:lysophospholipid acyltransferase family protein [Halalkalibacter sp. APA_J-10(15)]MCK0469841.1 1-acyl-sn-glycerol-3-phosphate acyltransferase [Halalkalibacter sp. APA_J-10(15)]